MNMTRKASWLVGVVIAAVPVSFVVLAAAGNTPTRTQPQAQTDAPTVGSLAGALEQFRWGQSHAEVTRLMNQTGGVFDTDYNQQLARMQPGVAMQSVEAERDQKKKFFEQSWIQF